MTNFSPILTFLECTGNSQCTANHQFCDKNSNYCECESGFFAVGSNDCQPSPIGKCSANPITVTPIRKWEFENEEHSIRGLYMTFFEKNLFKFLFSHKRFQMEQKIHFYHLYKL